MRRPVLGDIAVAVHELGHMLGLNHNASVLSVMYFLNVKGTEVLDGKDILDLSSHHKLCDSPMQLFSPVWVDPAGIPDPLLLIAEPAFSLR
jgi:hypothetical protein